ncbi:hypothetical protein CRV24_004624 [Beauveria bassiana]|nr:hypothetical protein CRV24_004624 [Beauveria bassiana]
MTYPLALMDPASQATDRAQPSRLAGLYNAAVRSSSLFTIAVIGPLAGPARRQTGPIVQTPDPMPPRNGPVKMSFLDGRGCNATDIVPHPGIPPGSPFTRCSNIGYQDSRVGRPVALQGPGCRPHRLEHLSRHVGQFVP